MCATPRTLRNPLHYKYIFLFVASVQLTNHSGTRSGRDYRNQNTLCSVREELSLPNYHFVMPSCSLARSIMADNGEFSHGFILCYNSHWDIRSAWSLPPRTYSKLLRTNNLGFLDHVCQSCSNGLTKPPVAVPTHSYYNTIGAKIFNPLIAHGLRGSPFLDADSLVIPHATSTLQSVNLQTESAPLSAPLSYRESVDNKLNTTNNKKCQPTTKIVCDAQTKTRKEVYRETQLTCDLGFNVLAKAWKTAYRWENLVVAHEVP